MTAIPLQTGYIRFYDPNTGRPLACGEVQAYEAGTAGSTRIPKDTWEDQAQTVLNGNPVSLDNTGGAYMFGDGFYDLVLIDKCNTEVKTFENVGWLVEGSTPNSSLPDLNI